VEEIDLMAAKWSTELTPLVCAPRRIDTPLNVGPRHLFRF
jgi:hypothetical protein